MTQAVLAQRMGRPRKTISEIVKGKARITPATAIQLERCLVRLTGLDASFWLKLDAEHRLEEARQRTS